MQTDHEKCNPKIRTQQAKQLYRIYVGSWNVQVNKEFLILLRMRFLGTWENAVAT